MFAGRVVGALTGAVFAVAITAGPSFACKGATVQLQDDFTDVDPAWSTNNGTVKIGDGKLLAQSDPGKIFWLEYDGAYFGTADACVSITAPNVRDPSTVEAGLGFMGADGSAFFIVIKPNGMAGVQRLTSDGWLNPVPPRKSDAIKTEPGAVNTLRVVWKGPPPNGSNAAPDPTVQIFINDKPFINFKAPPNSNRYLYLYAESEGSQYQLSRLIVTK
jgi:hypothetical protein